MKIKALHQIEMTSRCNLRCKYCPHPHMERPKVDMTMETFKQSLLWANYFIRKGTQKELNLAGIGESTLHPEFETMVRMAHKVVNGTDCKLILATNGIEIVKRPELADVLKECDVWTWVSLHRPEKAGPAVEILKKAGVLRGVSADPSMSSIDWAGQVDWFVSTNVKGQKCFWTHEGRVVALADGRISRCCLDAEGIGVLGNVYDDLTMLSTGPYDLCLNCHLDAGIGLENNSRLSSVSK